MLYYYDKAMRIEEKKEKFLKSLKLREDSINEFRENYYSKLDFFQNVKGLFKYRTKYLKYIISIYKPLSVKILTFWGENFWTTLPREKGLYFFGSLGNLQEITLTKFFIRNFEQNSIFYDVGAHSGFYSMLARELIGRGEIHSFEPVPKIFKLLQKNMDLKKEKIFLNCSALSKKKGVIDFYEDLEGGGRSTSILLNLTYDPKSPPYKETKVPSITLDEYCQKHTKPDFVKIDVEGGEYNVILGGKELFRNDNPIIAVEICRKPLYNIPHKQSLDLLYSLGYKSYKINQEGELELIERIYPEKDIPENLGWDNFIFKK